jgi:ABC-2 type transport system permease protein
MSKILNIAWKELFITYTDRSLLLIMIVTPLALSTIIGSAFSGFIGGSAGSDIPVRDIPVALVNLDVPVEANGQDVHLGRTFVSLFLPSGSSAQNAANPLLSLTEATLLTDAAQARAGVDAGTYNAAVIIPEDFSRSLTPTMNDLDLRVSPVEVYTSRAAPVSASIIRSVTENIVNQFVTGGVTIAATLGELTARARQDLIFGLQFAAGASGWSPDFAAAFNSRSQPITIDQRTVSGEVAAFNPLVAFGAAQALFFMIFTAVQSANSVLYERRDGTLQRMIVSPTSRLTILLGKLLGALANCIVQVTLLFFFLNIVGIVLSGRLQIIWGDHLGLVALVIVAGSLAACGIGAVITAIARTPEQVNIIGSLLAMFFGLFSGAFFDLRALGSLAALGRVTPNFWAVDAFTQLSLGRVDIGLNLAVLLLIGAVTFLAGLTLFERRLNV